MSESDKIELKQLCLEILTENNAKIVHNKYGRRGLAGLFLNKLSEKYKGQITGEVVNILKESISLYETTEDY